MEAERGHPAAGLARPRLGKVLTVELAGRIGVARIEYGVLLDETRVELGAADWAQWFETARVQVFGTAWTGGDVAVGAYGRTTAAPAARAAWPSGRFRTCSNVSGGWGGRTEGRSRRCHHSMSCQPPSL